MKINIVKYPYITVSIFTVCFLGMTTLYADEEYSVKLEHIEKIKSQEKRGDELYISVTEFPTVGTPSHYQIPNFPTHWLSARLTNVKDVTIWRKNIKSCDNVKVIFSLVEQDIAPWNIDDLLGSVELTLTCENGKLVPNWVIPNSAITQKVQNEKDSFSFTGENAVYRAHFKLEQKTTVPNK